MTTFQKTLSVLLILAATITGCLVFSYLIKYFFIGLGYLFNYPAESLIVTILIGITISLIPSETLSK